MEQVQPLSWSSRTVLVLLLKVPHPQKSLQSWVHLDGWSLIKEITSIYMENLLELTL